MASSSRLGSYSDSADDCCLDPTQAVDENLFTIMQFNANGIGNKLTELGEFLKRHNVKVVVIQSSPLILRLQASRTSPQYERTVVKAKEVVYSP